jgi:dihydropteroate synthase
MGLLRALFERRERALLMGILNRTPDSFSDGGAYLDDARALARVDAMVREGAVIVDIGAESTRPGAPSVSDLDQLARLGDIVRASSERVLVSVDTTSPGVAARALEDGARMINSVSLEGARELGRIAARKGAALVLTHSRGAMNRMAGFSSYAKDAYGDVVADVLREWKLAADEALAGGLPREDLVLDPGFGFFKNAEQSLELCARVGELCALGYPVLIGASRKSFLARAAGEDPPPPPDHRLGAGLAAAILCVERGASIVRTHDVAETRQALAFAAAISRASRGSGEGGEGGSPREAPHA